MNNIISFSDDIQQWLLHAIPANAEYSTVKTGTRTSECVPLLLTACVKSLYNPESFNFKYQQLCKDVLFPGPGNATQGTNNGGPRAL